jgi:glucose/mannose-6-phosphate isomerase
VFDGPFAPWPPAGPGAVDEKDPRPAVPLRLVILRDSQEHPQVARGRAAAVALAEQRGIEVSELAAGGDQPLVRLASLVQLIDYATVFLGIANGVDPGPVAVVGDLKDRIA